MSTDAPEQIDLQHDEDGNRFVLRSSGEDVGIIDYRRDGDVFDLHHTEVLPQGRGRGLGKVLARETLDHIRDDGGEIMATCPFVARFVDEHGEYADLLAADGTQRPALDLPGCGTGFVPAWMARRGAEVVGVDISAEQPATARRRLVEFNLDFADWLRVFRDSGFAVEDHPELSIPRSTEHRHGVTIEWARRFPADQVWQLRRT